MKTMRSYLRSSVVDQILEQPIGNILRRPPVVVSKHSSFGVHCWQRILKPRVAGFLRDEGDFHGTDHSMDCDNAKEFSPAA